MPLCNVSFKKQVIRFHFAFPIVVVSLHCASPPWWTRSTWWFDLHSGIMQNVCKLYLLNKMTTRDMESCLRATQITEICIQARETWNMTFAITKYSCYAPQVSGGDSVSHINLENNCWIFFKHHLPLTVLVGYLAFILNTSIAQFINLSYIHHFRHVEKLLFTVN